MSQHTATLYTTSGFLPVTPLFDFTKSLEFIHNFTPMYGEQVVTTNAFTKATVVNGRCIAFRVEDSGSIELPQVKYILFSTQRNKFSHQARSVSHLRRETLLASLFLVHSRSLVWL